MEDPEVVAKTPDGVGLMLSEAELLVEVSVIDGSPVRFVTALVSSISLEKGKSRPARMVKDRIVEIPKLILQILIIRNLDRLIPPILLHKNIVLIFILAFF